MSKGSKPRPTNMKAYSKNYDIIFKKSRFPLMDFGGDKEEKQISPSSNTFLERFLLFAGYSTSDLRGVETFIDSFKTMDDALNDLDEQELYNKVKYDWYHVYDCHADRIVWTQDGPIDYED